MEEDVGKQKFNEMVAKQSKITKKVLLITFGVLGVFFAFLGLMLRSDLEDGFYIFIGIGGFYILLGVILYFVIPEKYDYEKFKQRSKKLGYINYYHLSGLVFALEAENEELKNKVAELEERIENLERNR